MCGIAGYSLSEYDADTLDAHDLAARLLVQIENRGPHATGVAWHDADGTWWHKSPGRATRYVRDMPLSPNATTAILHTRYATHGSPSRNGNNHPFALPGVTGVHNGILSNHRETFDRLGVEPTTETDSEALFAALAYRAPGETRVDALQTIRGDAAVAWVEPEFPDRLYLARLNGRPLVVGTTEGGSLLFASTAEAIRKAAWLAEVHLDDEPRGVPEWTYLVVVAGQVHRVDRFEPAAPGVRHNLVSTPRRPLYDRVDPRDHVSPALRLGASQ
jgi:glucosamine 6-phosphate synthetase-like amidotransferase/phosphosugar isomerase protein